ncbi:class D sortase [Alicyclobacillus sp. ALC3]|uniref:class D sortase n=1 Tax=Alicyclobacillus sp. ALC3 TaxID=2796143 RepID=UPI002378F9FE|nr:class D sortase [Alicyclobacillus sp. ALC3]WDL98039.1 class D sortase [Alicyclobacillus sp. ALC3]
MRFAGRSRKQFLRALLLVGGGALMIAGALEIGRIPLAYFRVARAEQTTVSKPLVKVQIVAPPPARVVSYSVNALYPPAAATGQQPATASLMGRLVISKLGISAPVTQGTALSILAVSVGHLSSSVLPGEVGTTVLAAHDVTYFHHIDELAAGDTLTVQTSQGVFTYKVVSHQVISVGTNVPNTPYPSLVLETCYPLDALQLVNQRYVVRAVLVASHLTPSSAANQ